MAKYYNIKLTSGTSNGPYTIYYDSVNLANIATIVSSATPASGLTYNNVYPNGVNISVPSFTTSLIVYNTSCNDSDSFVIPTPTPTPTATPTPTPTPTEVGDLCFEFELTEIQYDRTLTFTSYEQGLFRFDLSAPINDALYVNVASIDIFDTFGCYGNQYFNVDQFSGGGSLVGSLKINACSTTGTKMSSTPLTGSTLSYKFSQQINVFDENLINSTYLSNNDTFTYNGLIIKVIIDNDCHSYNIITPTPTATPTPTPTPFNP
jgi:hypothetical protein